MNHVLVVFLLIPHFPPFFISQIGLKLTFISSPLKKIVNAYLVSTRNGLHSFQWICMSAPEQFEWR